MFTTDFYSVVNNHKTTEELYTIKSTQKAWETNTVRKRVWSCSNFLVKGFGE